MQNNANVWISPHTRALFGLVIYDDHGFIQLDVSFVSPTKWKPHFCQQRQDAYWIRQAITKCNAWPTNPVMKESHKVNNMRRHVASSIPRWSRGGGEDISTPGELKGSATFPPPPTHEALASGITYHHDPLKIRPLFEVLGAFYLSSRQLRQNWLPPLGVSHFRFP